VSLPIIGLFWCFIFFQCVLFLCEQVFAFVSIMLHGNTVLSASQTVLTATRSGTHSHAARGNEKKLMKGRRVACVASVSRRLFTLVPILCYMRMQSCLHCRLYWPQRGQERIPTRRVGTRKSIHGREKVVSIRLPSSYTVVSIRLFCKRLGNL